MKTLYATIILFLAAITAFGQEGNFLIGIEAGPSQTSIRNKSNSRLKSTVGYAAGASFEYMLNKNMGLKSGLLFEQKGAKDDIMMTDIQGNNIGNLEIDIKYQYLVLPLLFAYHTGGNPDFYVNLGPYAGFLLSNMVYYEDTDQYDGMKEDFTSETNSVDTDTDPSELPENVSFSQDIQPIFNQSCGGGVCHISRTNNSFRIL